MNLIEAYCTEYLDKIFYYSLKRTGDEQSAGELASDISCAVIASLRRGTVPENFSAWVWKIAANQYGRFAKAHWYSESMLDLDALAEVIPDNTDPEDDLILASDLALMRRELALIRTDYRQILVAHYIDELSVSKIAERYHLPVGTVKTKLQSGRKALKKGMDMAREFGKRSYNPEEVWFSNSCSRFGEHGQPWTILNHKLYKNIFLESYGNPSTAEQLSMELGIAMPYMEDELAFLVRETFLTKDGDKYQTAFPIVSADALLAILAKQEAAKEEVASLIAKLTDDFIDLSAARGVNVCVGQDREVAKWVLSLKVLDKLSRKMNRYKFDYHDRPYNGKWDIIGYQIAELPKYERIGLHGAMSDDPELPAVFYECFKFYNRPWYKLTPDYLTHIEAYTLYKLAVGEKEGLSEHVMEKLRGWGYIDADNNPLIVVLREPDYLTDADRAALSATADKIRAVLKGVNDAAREITAADLPAYIRNDEHLLEFACASSAMGRGIIFDTLMKQGWLTCRENMPKSTGAYIII